MWNRVSQPLKVTILVSAMASAGSPQARFPAGERYQVIRNFQPNHPQEIPLRQNDIVVLQRREGPAWFGSLSDGRSGWFPSNCVQPDTSPPPCDSGNQGGSQGQFQQNPQYSPQLYSPQPSQYPQYPPQSSQYPPHYPPQCPQYPPQYPPQPSQQQQQYPPQPSQYPPQYPQYPPQPSQYPPQYHPPQPPNPDPSPFNDNISLIPSQDPFPQSGLEDDMGSIHLDEPHTPVPGVRPLNPPPIAGPPPIEPPHPPAPCAGSLNPPPPIVDPEPNPTQPLKPISVKGLGWTLGEILLNESEITRGWDNSIFTFKKILDHLFSLSNAGSISDKGILKLLDFEVFVVDDAVANGGRVSCKSMEIIKKTNEYCRSGNEGALFEETRLLGSIPNERLYHPSFDGSTFNFVDFDLDQNDPMKKKFRVTDAAKNFLGTLKMPVAAITVVGPFRSGKSYLLNNLAGLECRERQVLGDLPAGSNFSVSSAGVGETTGMRAYPLFLPPNTRLPDQWPAKLVKYGVCLLLIDCQGFQDVQVSGGENLDVKLLSVALLLSSLLIVNVNSSGGAIMRDDLNHLGAVTKITNEMKVGDIPPDSNMNPKDLLHNVFPELLWLSRNSNVDFQQHPTAYFRSLLEKTDGGLQKNEEREAIAQCFNNIQMFPLSDPEVNALPGPRLAPETWNKEFQKEFHELVELIMSMVKPKRHFSPEDGLGEEIASGEDFLGLLEEIIESSNANDMPDFTRSLAKIQNSHRARLATQAERIFDRKMKEFEDMDEPLDSTTFLAMLNNAVTEALGVYDGGRHYQKYRGYGEERIGVSLDGEPPAKGTQYAYYIEENNKRAKNYNNALLRRLFSPIRRKVSDGDYTPEEFDSDVKDAYDKYCKEAKGSEGVIADVKETFIADVVEQNKAIVRRLLPNGGRDLGKEMNGMSRMYREEREAKRKVQVQTLRYNEAKKQSIRIRVKAQQAEFERKNRNKNREKYTGLSRAKEFEEREQRAKKDQQIREQMMKEALREKREAERKNEELQARIRSMQNAQAEEREASFREYDEQCRKKERAPERMESDPRFHTGGTPKKGKQADGCPVM